MSARSTMNDSNKQVFNIVLGKVLCDASPKKIVLSLFIILSIIYKVGASNTPPNISFQSGSSLKCSDTESIDSQLSESCPQEKRMK